MSIETKDLVAAFKRRPVVAVCAALIVVLGLRIYFTMGSDEVVQDTLREREKELGRLTANTKFSAQLDSQLETLRKANATIAAGALRVGDLAGNQQVFFRLEEQTGAKLLDLRPLNVPPPKAGAPAFVGIPFSLTIKGEYFQLMDFLMRLDRGATLARVTTASIARPADGGQSLSLTVELLGFRP